MSSRPVQDLVRSALHGVRAAVPGPLAQPAGGSAQREEDASVLGGVAAHGSSVGLVGHRPAQDQDGCFPPKVGTGREPLGLLRRFPGFWGDNVLHLFGVDRFKIQNKFNLRSVLPAMGIVDALSPTAADFSGISGRYFLMEHV